MVGSTSVDTVSQQISLWALCKRSKTVIDSVPASRSLRLPRLSAVPGPLIPGPPSWLQNPSFRPLIQEEQDRRWEGAFSQSSGRPQVAKQTL